VSAGDVTQGYRAENVQALYDGPPGGYVFVDTDDPDDGGPEGRVLWIKDPTGHVGRLGAHDVVEHEDGTVTVSPSIQSTVAVHGYDWHGYLESGVWREV
jgi:hypothetical protein